ncbi:N-acetylneuraminate lyase isoform X3 [Chelonia mydas]|uniref:N-acetylneuraminate lyase isoform X3 n=2 Tax=Chelonia mydas TaxID=8469 RepID=UPI001CA856F4|nr:N-acetylneuraminate lyase isoform X3 [Chelonia mydas]
MLFSLGWSCSPNVQISLFSRELMLCAVSVISILRVLGAKPVRKQLCINRTHSPLCCSMASPKRLQGLIAATITPMTPDGEINLSVIGQYVDYLVKEQGVKNVFVNGTTGEGLALSTQERKQLAEEWVTKGKNKLDHVIIHVGALSLPEAKELAKHAAAIGASGIAGIAPFFFKPTNKDTLVAFLREVASEAPGIPFYYYHIPPLTGVKIRVEELLDGIKEQIPTFQGVKFSDTDLLDFAQCVKNHKEQFVLLYGVDEFCTGEFLSFVFKLGFGVAQTKAVMTFTSGIPMGPPRLPLLSASVDFIEKAKAKMASLIL